MSKRSRESQVKTIRQIQSQVKTYIRWKECGTVAKYFKRSDFINHIYSIRLIFTLTLERKIASKASKLDHVLRIILKKEYNKEPNCAPLPYLRLKDGKKVPSNQRKIFKDKQMERGNQSTPTRRNRSGNISLPQRSDSRTLRTSQDVRKDKAPISLAKDARRDKTVHRVM